MKWTRFFIPSVFTWVLRLILERINSRHLMRVSITGVKKIAPAFSEHIKKMSVFDIDFVMLFRKFISSGNLTFQSMKKLWFLFILIFTNVLGISQPQGSSAYITELFFDENNDWTLEFYFDYYDPRDTGYLLVSPTDTAFFRKFPDASGFVVLTQADLDSPFSIDYDGDKLAGINPMHPLSNYGWLTDPFVWGTFDAYSNVVNPPGPGQSIVRLDNIRDYVYWEHKYFLVTDTVHSPGYLTQAPVGTVEGYLYDSTGRPLPFMGLTLSGLAEDCRHLYLWTDENGYFRDSSLYAKNYHPYFINWFPKDDYFTVEPGGLTYKDYTVPVNKDISVEGICLLEDNENAEGTRVIFDNLCPGVEPDTILTDSTGHFLYEATPGIYYLWFSHEGYIPSHYHTPFELYRSESIGTRTLSPGQVNEVPSGKVSGTWEDEDPYQVLGDITLESGDTLVIKPGVSIELATYTTFYVYGTLIMEGTAENYITLKINDGYSYNGLNLIGEETSGSIFEYVSFANQGYFNFFDSSPILKNLMFDDFSVWINIFRSSAPVFLHCVSTRYSLNTIVIGDYAAPVFRNNIFENAGLNCSGHSAPVLEYNNFYNGYMFLRCYNYARPSLTGNIFLLAEYGIYVNHGNGLDHVMYNSFFGLNVNGFYTGLPGFCELDTVNMNGDSCDYYFNITKHPRLIGPDSGDYRLQEISPCIDAGDPSSPLDPDSTIADIGAFYFDQLYISIESVASETSKVNVFPNPSSGTVEFDINLPEKYDGMNGFIHIFQVNGNRIRSYPVSHQDQQINRYRFNDLNCQAGAYLYQIEFGGEIISSGKLILTGR
jgi:hypothetical protein